MKKLICLLLLILTALAGCNAATVELPSNLPTLDFSFCISRHKPDASAHQRRAFGFSVCCDPAGKRRYAHTKVHL